MDRNRGADSHRALLRAAEIALRADDLDAVTRAAAELVELQLDASTAENGLQTTEHMRLRLDRGGRIKAAREMSGLIARCWPETPEGRSARSEGARREHATRQRRRNEAAQRAHREREERERRRRQRQERGERDLATQRAKAEADVSVVENAQQARDLASEHGRKGQDRLAVLFAERAVELAPDVPSMTRLAACQRNVCQYDEALATYREAWRLEEDRDIVRTGAAAVLADLGRLDDAWTTIEPAVSDEDPFALNCAGRIRRLLGDLQQAAEYHEQALRHRKGRRDALRELRRLVEQAREEGDEPLATQVTNLITLSE